MIPATSTAQATLYRRLLLATVVIAAIVFYWGLGGIALMSFNEARRALPAATMFASGDWLLPHINGELYITKPPLLYWISATFAHLIGSANEWAVRLPSALAASLIAWASYRYAYRKFGAWPALFTLQILVANAGFAMFARRAEIEMLLAALCSGALLAAWRYTQGEGGRGWVRVSYFLLGLAMLTKGPLALLFVTLPLLVDALIQKQPRQWEALRDPWGWLIFWVLGLSWYVAVTMHLGFDIWRATIEKDMLHKMHGASGEPFYDYLVWVVADYFPFSLLLFVAPLATWRRWKVDERCLSLLLAVAIPFLIYTLFSDKHDKYLLPVYPLLAILLGERMGELAKHLKAGARRWLLGLGVVMPLLYAGFYAGAEARIFDYRIAAFPLFERWVHTVKQVPLYGYRDLDERLLYYAGREIPMLDDAQLQKLRAQNTSMLLLAEGENARRVAPLAGCVVRSFSPYLKRGKSLEVLGFGETCKTVTQ